MKNRFFQVCILLLLHSCNGTDKKYNNDRDNPSPDAWLKDYPQLLNNPSTVDSSVISIRVSSNQVMRGFINTNMPTQGAFANLVHIFTGFRNADHNPRGNTALLFFNGSNNGVLGKSIGNDINAIGNQLFDPGNYAATKNNLHFQFRNISKEIRGKADPNTFYVIFSDGETTIRSQRNLNQTEFAEIKESLKDMLQANPEIEIGIISLLADFNGPYVYDPEVAKQVACKRYLYAYCIFDKKFLPEFNRFCVLNNRNGGQNLLFNPKFSINDVQTKYQDALEGQQNAAKQNGYSAYQMEMNGSDYAYTLVNTVKHDSIHFNPSVQMVITKLTETTPGRFDKPEVIEKKPVMFKNVPVKFTISGLRTSAILRIDYFHDFENMNLNGLQLVNQDINDNTATEVAHLTPSDTLKTEGLKDLCNMVIEALQESKKVPVFSNFIKLEKY